MRKSALLLAAAALFGSAAPLAAQDHTFTIAAIPDTQNYTDYTHQTAEGFKFDAGRIFLDQMAYITQNLKANGGDIAFVTALGDVWQHQTKLIDPDHAARGFKRVANPIIDGHAVDPQDNNPQMVWDKFLSQHDQIFLVLCGHEHGQALRVDNNRAGHPVWQVLADYQDRRQSAIDAGVKMGPGEGIGDGWLRLMQFDMGTATPSIRVRTYSTHYKKQSSDTADYAAWYKAGEKPKLSDEAFHGEDDYKIDLTGFRERFGAPR